MNDKEKHLLMLIATVLALVGGSAFAAYRTICMHKVPPTVQGDLFVDGDDDTDSVRTKSGLGWRWGLYERLMPFHPRTGHYTIKSGTKFLDLYRKLRNGEQDPIMLSVPSLRTTERLAAYLGKHLMRDSAEFAQAFVTESSAMGYTQETLPSLFIPNTYELYWDVSAQGFMKRMQRENDAFWTAERQRKAQTIGLSRTEVSTLASIVEEETANDAEKPMVAGLYLNRLRRGMLLQADPTVKFAMQAFGLRRIYNNHLRFESPYNTYLHPGLPPGPIRMPSIVGLDAVLNHTEHPYIYMCAKEDFSGTHNFAANYSEHLRNARRYTEALNKRGIR